MRKKELVKHDSNADFVKVLRGVSKQEPRGESDIPLLLVAYSVNLRPGFAHFLER